MMTNRKRMFIAEYLKDFNATRAAKAAGYSARSARELGSNLLTDLDIKAAIDERIMSADEAAARLTDIARGDISDLMALSTAGYEFELLIDDPDNPGEKIPNPKTKLIKRIKQKVTTILGKSESSEDREIVETELEIYSAHDAIKDILKYRGKLIDRTDITTGDKPINTTIEVKAIDYRAGIATLAPGSIPDSDTSSEGEDPVNGPAVG